MENENSVQIAVDFRRIQETSDGDLEFEHELFTVFIEDCAERIANLKNAVTQMDVKNIHLEAHTIKGAGANVGTVRLHEIAQKLEHADETVISQSGDTLIAELDAEFKRVSEAIGAYLAG